MVQVFEQPGNGSSAGILAGSEISLPWKRAQEHLLQACPFSSNIYIKALIIRSSCDYRRYNAVITFIIKEM